MKLTEYRLDKQFLLPSMCLIACFSLSDHLCLFLRLTGRKDGFAINLQMCKLVVNLTFKFASTSQWLFYYLCGTKFAIHTLINLHIRKFIASILHQICNGCFVIFTISNLQYIHTYLCTYANLSHQICIKFAKVVYS